MRSREGCGKGSENDTHPSASHLPSSGQASPFYLSYLSYGFIYPLLWLVPYSLSTSTNKQCAGLAWCRQEKPGLAGGAFPVWLALSTSLAIREQLGKTLFRLYLERSGRGNASSSNFHSVAHDCPSPPTPRPAPQGRQQTTSSRTWVKIKPSLCPALIMPAFKNKM